jgi:RNA polymerase sigma-70 factor (ECF subfamily)
MLTTEQSARSRRLAQLMVAAQAGDKEAFRTLVNEIGPGLTNFVRSRIFERAEIEDVCQEILIQVYESRHTFDPKRPLEPWLFAIARYVVIDHRRRYLQRSAHQQLTETEALPRNMGENMGNFLARFRQALSQLPPFQREALMMTKVDGLSIAESSRRAGTTIANMKVRVHRAAVLLKKAMLD